MLSDSSSSDGDSDGSSSSDSSSSDGDSDGSSSSCSSCGIVSDVCEEIVSNSKVRDTDQDAKDFLFVQLRSVTQELSKKRTDGNRHAISILAQALCSPDLIKNNLVSATQRLTGFKRDQIVDACTSNETRTRDEPSISTQQRKRRRRCTLRDEEFYYELIHESCPLVELVRHRRSVYTFFICPIQLFYCLGSIKENTA